MPYTPILTPAEPEPGPPAFRRRIASGQSGNWLILKDSGDSHVDDVDSHDAFHWPTHTYTVPQDGSYWLGFALERSGTPPTGGTIKCAPFDGANLLTHSLTDATHSSASQVVALTAGQVLRFYTVGTIGTIVEGDDSYVAILEL